MAVCLIAGGAGFLGSHLAEALLSRGESVVILDNFSHGTPENLASIRDQVEVIPGDLLSYTLARRCASRRRLRLPLRRALRARARGLGQIHSGGRSAPCACFWPPARRAAAESYSHLPAKSMGARIMIGSMYTNLLSTRRKVLRVIPISSRNPSWQFRPRASLELER